MENVLVIIGGIFGIVVPITTAIVWVAAKTTRIQTNDTTHNLKIEEANTNIKDNLHKIEITQEALMRLEKNTNLSINSLEKKFAILETNTNLLVKMLENSNKQIEQSNLLFGKLLDLLKREGG